MANPQIPTQFPQDQYYSENSQIVKDQMQEMVSELTSEDRKLLAMK